jgi:anti-anti-sigma factor
MIAAVTAPEPHPPYATGRITVADENGRPVLCLAGEVDVAVVQAYEDSAGDEAPNQATAFTIVDVSQVRFLDSTAPAFVLRRTGAASNPVLRPTSRGATGAVTKVLRLTGTESLLEVLAPSS